MEMTGFFTLLWWTLGGAIAVGACMYLFMEYQAYLLRTNVVSVPGGLRFSARGFSVEVRHGAKEVKVIANDAYYTRQSLDGGDEEPQTGALTVSLPALGLKIEVARVSVKGLDEAAAASTGLSRIVFAASDELTQQAMGHSGGYRSELRLNRVPDPIATDFQVFANGLRAWIDKIERVLAAEVAAQREREEQTLAQTAGLAQEPVDDSAVPLSEADREVRAKAQIEKWRAAAGFKGTSTEVSFDARGQIAWLIDLNPSGQVILHAAKRTFHGSLRGATVTGVGTELELSVRDDYWSEEDPRLVAFRILGGATPENRRAWKERLELMIQGLSKSSVQAR